MLGFACICKSLKENGRFRATTAKHLLTLDENAQKNKLKSIAVDNLYNTYKIINWCKENNIGLYRMTSDLIPMATYFKDWNWWEDSDIVKQCNNIKKAVEDGSIRISMHPDQFCILNSDKANVVANSIDILEYHNRLSNLIGNKLLIIHVGSTAGGKASAIQRFIDNFKLLDIDIKNKIALENDDKKYTVTDVLSICEELGIPMVLDLHHHRCCNEGDDINLVRQRIIDTWKNQKPKLHLSSGKAYSTDRSHADYISQSDYQSALTYAKDDFDIMLECKEKDLALLKLIG